MLQRLFIKNFAIIDELDIEFSSGFNVITGETGAGKSIIIDALELLLGKPAQEDFIKASQTKAVVEGHFSLKSNVCVLYPEFFEENSHDLVVTRIITKEKGNSIRINGITASIKVLKHIGSFLVNIVGQHDHMELLESNQLLLLLDSYSGQDIHELLEQYKAVFSEYKSITSVLNEAKERLLLNDSQADFLKFQIHDIEQHEFLKNEDIDLKEKRILIKNQKALRSSLINTIEHLSETQNYLIKSEKSMRELPFLVDSSEFNYENIVSQFQIELDSMLNTFQRKLHECNLNNEDMPFDIEARLDLIFKQKTKYKVNSIDELLEKLDMLRNHHQTILEGDDYILNLEKQRSDLSAQLRKLSNDLNECRKLNARKLSQEVLIHLKDLHFQYSEFNVEVMFDENNFSERGSNSVEFFITTNAGIPMKAMKKIASGGELSRIMLAIRSVFLEYQSIPTTVFDEIDTGVGGITAIEIGKKIKSISSKTQLFCITHLPQIAKYADHHFQIVKSIENGNVKTNVKKLNSNLSKEELQRMVGGHEIIDKIR